MKDNILFRNIIRLYRKIIRVLYRCPARLSETLSDTVYLIRNGHRKSIDLIKRYAEETGVVSDIHPDDHIFRFILKFPEFKTREEAIKYYFFDGLNSSQKISTLLFSQLCLKRSVTTSLLEFASGYGCVTRHLISQLAPVKIVACDIHEAACSFIESTIGAKAILSSTKPEALAIEDSSFDVVFALSFFSHMPDRTFGPWLKTLFSKVKPGGYFIFTTHGITSWQNIGKPPLPDNGIWFSPKSEQKDLDRNEYGSSIVTPEYVDATAKHFLGQTVHLHIEAFWWGHQDLYIIKKPTSG